MLIEHILHRKGREVETISAAARVARPPAVRLRDRNIGALVVMSDADAEGVITVAGILSERDVVRALGVAEADSAAVLGQPVSPS